MLRKFGLLLLAAATAFTASAAAWITDLPDDMPVRQMSIPGAHDAATSSITGSFGKCQDKTVAELWESGVRAFDFRPKYNSGNLTIYHGTLSTGRTMSEVMTTLKEKLAAHPGEFAFVIVKCEEDISDNWKTAMQSLMEQFDADIVPWSRDMTIADARGKFIVWTRDDFTYSKKAFADRFGDNQEYKEGYIYGPSSESTLWLQDYYETSGADAKTAAVNKMLDYSCGNHFAPTWVLNHTSGYKKPILVSKNSDITDNANAVNKSTLDYLNANPAGRTGLLMMDFAGSPSYSGADLVNAVIARNSVPVYLNEDQVAAFFRDRGNWIAGPACKGIGGSNHSAVTFVESYRDDSHQNGEVMYCECPGIENGRYFVTVSAHAQWTPGRGEEWSDMRNAHCTHNALGYTQMYLNDVIVDIPVIHNTAFVEPLSTYVVPVTVTDGKMRISVNNIHKGANWHTVYVVSVLKDSGDEPLVFNQDMANGYVSVSTTTGAQNHNLVNNASMFPTQAYENWHGSAMTAGSIRVNVSLPNASYRVLLDVNVNNNDGNSVFFYANDKESKITTTEIESKELVVDVTDNKLEFGVKFNGGTTNWAAIDNARIMLLGDMDENTDNTYSDHAHYFGTPSHWGQGDASTQGCGYKDDTFVENWQSANNAPEGTIMHSERSGLEPGAYLVGIYAFSCYTGSGQTDKADGAKGYAYLRVNNTLVDMPTYRTGTVPTPHELYYVPTEVDQDGLLSIAIDAYGYPNWFMADVVGVLPFSTGEDLNLKLAPLSPYRHDKNTFATEMSLDVQNNNIKSSDSGISPDESFFENWHKDAYSGRYTSTVYLHTAEYEVSLDCFAQNIPDNLDDYYFFATAEGADDVKVNKTNANGFETLTGTITVTDPSKQNAAPRRAPSADQTTPLFPLNYGFAMDQPATNWTGIKNPSITLKAGTTTGLKDILPAIDKPAAPADDRIFDITGRLVGRGSDALGSLRPGVYIMNGQKYLVR